MVIRSEGAVEYVMIGVSRRPTQAIWRGKEIEHVQVDEFITSSLNINQSMKNSLERRHIRSLHAGGQRLRIDPVSSILKDEPLYNQVAAVAEWYRYRIVACFVTGSSPVPLKTHRVGQRCTLNLSRAETSSRWCGVVVRRGGASSGVVHVT
ncbi:uncharacterized protein TNCV_3945841 [Trichonephila clavipes]|nr:uncharacterized protein TNCV_3945841 [Trichonephila clavipes]